MSLKPILEALALPPANLPLFILIGLYLCAAAGPPVGPRRRRARWQRGLGTWIAGLSFAALIALGMPAVASVLLDSLETGMSHWQAPASEPPRAIVILSGDIERGQGQPPKLMPGGLSWERLAEGAALARHTGLPVLISGGSLRPGETPIATVMAEAMKTDFGISVRWQEIRSADTWQNAAFSALILREAGIASAYVVTNAWHMRRARLAFRKTGIAFSAAPVLRDMWPVLSVWDFVPDVHAWLISYYALHEWVGCADYALR